MCLRVELNGAAQVGFGLLKVAQLDENQAKGGMGFKVIWALIGTATRAGSSASSYRP